MELQTAVSLAPLMVWFLFPVVGVIWSIRLVRRKETPTGWIRWAPIISIAIPATGLMLSIVLLAWTFYTFGHAPPSERQASMAKGIALATTPMGASIAAMLMLFVGLLVETVRERRLSDDTSE